MKTRPLFGVIMALSILLTIESVSAQNFIMQGHAEEKTKIGLRFMHPNFSDNFLVSNLSTFSGAYDLFINARISSRLNIVASVPFNTFSADGADGESSVGDIYLGIQTRGAAEGRGQSFEFGVFLPTASQDKFLATLLGLNTNFHEFQRSLPDVLTIYNNFTFYSNQINGPTFAIEIGPQLFIVTEGGGDAELFAHYGVRGGFQFSNVALFAELLGIAIITSDVGSFGDRFNHSIDFGAQLTGHTVNPGVFYVLPLDEDQRDALSGVLGIKVDFVLP